jgi:uncharacterized membrane protein YoaK (UPF0700 family)
VVSLTTVIAGGLESKGWAPLRPLLILQFLLLAGFLIVCIAAGPRLDPRAINGILAGMLGVSAMAVQHALVQISVEGAPATAVMTSNVTRFAIAAGEMMLRGAPDRIKAARTRAARTWPAIAGFAIGCGIGAASEAALGMWSLILPACLALIALAIGGVADRRDAEAY